MSSNYEKNLPNQEGYFGEYGGKYVPETLMLALSELESTYLSVKGDLDFQKEIDKDLSSFVGRPSPLYFAERLTKKYQVQKFGLKERILITQVLTRLIIQSVKLFLLR